MNDGFNKPSHEESNEFEDYETAQPAQTQTPQASQVQGDQNGQALAPDTNNVQDKFNIKDEVGKAIETVTSSLFGSTDPAQVAEDQQKEAEKKNEDAKKAANIKNFLDQMAADEARLRAQRQEEAQKKQEEAQEEQVEKQQEQMKKDQKEQSFQQQHILAEQSKAERKGGVGG